MYSLSEIGFKEYYMLDGYEIYNNNRKCHIKPVSEFRYRLVTKDGIYKSVTIKEIYKKLFDKVFCIDNVKRLNEEEFKEIEGTDGKYLCSNKGRILSYIGNYSMLLKPTITPKGYERVQLYIDGRKVNKFVHTLVCMTWIGNPKSLDCCIHHIDRCKTNNDISNLCYVTTREHMEIHSNKRKDNDNANSKPKNNTYTKNNR